MAGPKPCLLVGIDFGTTYSGVAWAWSERLSRLEPPNVITRWDGLEGQKTSSKVPTKIFYKGNETRWGFNVPKDEPSLSWFKLLLLKDENMEPEIRDSQYIKTAKELLKKFNKTAEQVVADYLGLLWRHALKDMRVNLGEGGLDGQPIQVVITVPAIWPVYAQSRMRTAAQTAGIYDFRHGGETKLKLCPEPEAAALAAMDDFDGHPVESGETFVICDAGGGTADLVTYQIEDTTMWEMAECIAGAGKLCGAILVDEQLEKQMLVWVGSKKWMGLSDTKKKDWMGGLSWEYGLKTTFTGNEQDLGLFLPMELVVSQKLSFSFPLRRKKNAKRPVRGNELRLQKGDVAGVFDVSVEKILALVKQQISETQKRVRITPKAVILVGGFGQSPYLYNRLKEALKGESIDVRKPRESSAWTAVCRGAVMRASILNAHDGGHLMRVNITSRVVRASYGIAAIERFDPTIHSIQDKQYIASIDADCAVYQMDWYLRINENIGDQQVITRDWSRKIRSPLHRSRFTVTLLRCDQEHPPRRKGDEGVRVEGEIICQVNTPFDQLPQYTNKNGEVWKDIEFQVEMRPLGTMLEFVVVYNGERQRPLQVNPPFAAAQDGSQLLLTG